MEESEWKKGRGERGNKHLGAGVAEDKREERQTERDRETDRQMITVRENERREFGIARLKGKTVNCTGGALSGYI